MRRPLYIKVYVREEVRPGNIDLHDAIMLGDHTALEE